MANENISGREPDPLVESLRPGAALMADRTQLPGPTFEGFFDHGDQPGYERLFLTGGAYIEFKAEHVVDYADIPPDRSPVLGEPATLVRLQRDAPVEYVRDQVTNEFEIRMRLHQVPANELARFEDEAALQRYYTTMGSSKRH